MAVNKNPTIMNVDQPTEPASIEVPPATGLELDPFAPENLRLNETYETPKPLFTSCPRVKYKKGAYVRANPDPNYRMEIGLIVPPDGKSEEVYALAPTIAKRLSEDDYTKNMIYTGMMRNGSIFLWYVRQPNRDGKIMECHRVLHEGASLCMTEWHRIQWSDDEKNYKIIPAKPGVIPEPDWSEIPPFHVILRVAFQRHFIDSFDHQILRDLRGE